jgi:hypothetical protein
MAILKPTNFSSLAGPASRFLEDSKGATPWQDTVGDDVFFSTPEIIGANWSKIFPYRLLVVDTSKEGNPVVVGLRSSQGTTIETKTFKIGEGYVLSQRVTDSFWIYDLPITPQQIQIVDQYAINTVATARGVLEEHNGLKFKMISINATTGIYAGRSTTGAGADNKTTNLASVFAGTLQASSNLANSLGRVKSAYNGSKLGDSQGAGTVDEKQTGYYKALLLSNFLERYAQEKKKPQNKGWRLVLDIPKMNVSYVVTPMTFSLQKSVQSPNEFNISMQLKAWKRIKINQSQKPILAKPFTISPNDFQRVLNTIRETRRVLSNSINLLRAVRSDFQTPLEALRQTALAVKDLAGVAVTTADLPNQIINDYRTSIQSSLDIISNSFKRSNSGTGGSVKLESQEAKSAFIAASLSKEKGLNEGLSLDQVNAGAIGLEVAQAAQLRNSNRLFNQPEEFFDTLDSVDVQSLTLSPDQTDRIEDEVASASLTNIDDLKRFKNDILETALLISNNYGSGDETYSRIYNRPPPKQRTTPLTVEETEVVTALFEAIREYDALTASRFFDDLKVQNPMEYVGGLANDAEIDFTSAEGKKLVPVPFNLTIEQIAARYLGDANRWLEIVTLNKLRLPYIDEEGFTYNLLSNGSGRQINVNDEEQRLYIGQWIVLSSTITPPFRRRIINVERISDTNYLVTVDGEDNLDILTTNNQAKIKGYLPGTVNSQNQIFIPIDGAVEEDDLVTLPKIFEEDKLAKISKIDWLLDDNGDLAINQAGEIQLAGGLTNLIQALKLKIKTRKGTLLQHLDYGLGITHGISIADVESGELIKELTRMINDDPRYDGINRLNIRVDGNALFIDLAVNLASGTGVLPITFEV